MTRSTKKRRAPRPGCEVCGFLHQEKRDYGHRYVTAQAWVRMPVPDRVRAKLEWNAHGAETQAALALREAAALVDKGRDVDDVLGLLFEAVLHLGEARGHRNARVDLCEDGSDILNR